MLFEDGGATKRAQYVSPFPLFYHEKYLMNKMTQISFNWRVKLFDIKVVEVILLCKKIGY
jgi:hypothetical protein